MARKIEHKNSQKGSTKIKRMLNFQSFPYLPEMIRTKIISRYHNNLLATYLKINKT